MKRLVFDKDELVLLPVGVHGAGPYVVVLGTQAQFETSHYAWLRGPKRS